MFILDRSKELHDLVRTVQLYTDPSRNELSLLIDCADSNDLCSLFFFILLINTERVCPDQSVPRSSQLSQSHFEIRAYWNLKSAK